MRATPIDVGDVCLNHDVAFFEEQDVDLPTDLADLTDPAYEGMLAVQNPATSSPGLSFLMATIERFGEDGYLEFWEGLVANDVVVTDGWSEAYYEEFSGTGGDRPLVVSYASSPPAEVFFAEEEPDEAPSGVIEASWFRQIEFVGILDGTPHETEAQQLVDFMLDTESQEDIPLTMFVFPVNEQAQLPEVFVEHAVLPEALRVIDDLQPVGGAEQEVLGTVTARRFAGDHVRVAIDTRAGPVLNVPVWRGAPPEPGQPIRLALDPAGVHVLEPERDEPAGP